MLLSNRPPRVPTVWEEKQRCCACGHSITDTTDFIEYKASLIPDQDDEDLIDRICGEVRTQLKKGKISVEQPGSLELDDPLFWAVADNLRHYTRTMYQCTECGRLYVDDPTDLLRLHGFVPEDEGFPRRLLRSVEGDRWKRPMGASWSDRCQAGDLWWSGSGEDPGGWEEFDDWEQLKQRYFEVFTELRRKDIIRTAFLRRGDRTVHDWPEEPRQRAPGVALVGGLIGLLVGGWGAAAWKSWTQRRDGDEAF